MCVWLVRKSKAKKTKFMVEKIFMLLWLKRKHTKFPFSLLLCDNLKQENLFSQEFNPFGAADRWRCKRVKKKIEKVHSKISWNYCWSLSYYYFFTYSLHTTPHLYKFLDVHINVLHSHIMRKMKKKLIKVAKRWMI